MSGWKAYITLLIIKFLFKVKSQKPFSHIAVIFSNSNYRPRHAIITFFNKTKHTQQLRPLPLALHYTLFEWSEEIPIPKSPPPPGTESRLRWVQNDVALLVCPTSLFTFDNDNRASQFPSSPPHPTWALAWIDRLENLGLVPGTFLPCCKQLPAAEEFVADDSQHPTYLSAWL